MCVFTHIFYGCQPLLFKDLTLALQSNRKPFGKLIRLGKLFRFLMQLRWQKFNIPLALCRRAKEKTRVFARLSPATRGLVLEQVQTEGAGFSSSGVSCRRCSALLPMWRLRQCVSCQEFNFSGNLLLATASGRKTFSIKINLPQP